VSFPADFFFQAHLEKKSKKKEKRKKKKEKRKKKKGKRKKKKEKKKKKENGRRGARPSELPVHRSRWIVGYVHSRDSHGV
jgi:hypothetical protein